MDDAITKLVENTGASEEEMSKQMYRMNFSHGLINELYKGVYWNKRHQLIYKAEYTWPDILMDLTPFQQTLLSHDELDQIGYISYQEAIRRRKRGY